MNNGYTYRERINQRGAGQAVHAYLSGRYTHSSPDAWHQHIEAGRVLLDGEPTTADTPLALRQELTYHRPPWEEPSAPLALPVLLEDESFVVVAKPPGLPTMPGGGFLQHTLVHQLRRRFPAASPMHRLGRWTSGAVLCSRSRAAGAHIAAQFSGRTIHKRYRALATGRPAAVEFGVDVPIGPVPYAPLGTVHAASPTGRRASSRIRVVEQRDGCFVCHVTIATGRPHQIRIHLAAAGHPLVGDPLYGVGGLPLPGCTAVPGDPGYHLHAAELGFQHPRTDAPLVVHAPLPPGDASA
jgi:23S rRNA pseudouridine1911/1915/1917 synthase